MFLDRGIPDAMLIISINIDEEISKRLKSAGIPVVLVGAKHDDFNYMFWNNYKGGYLAGEHLIKQGYKKIGMVRSHSKSIVADQREQGFRGVLKTYNLPLEENYFVKGITRKHSGYSEEAGYEAVQIMKERGGLPEAIFCTNDAQAIGVMHALREDKMRIPEDIGVMGYDNIKTAQYLGLSTIDQKMYDVGMMSIDRLTTMIKEKDTSIMQSEIEPRLVVRNSTRRP